MGGRILKLILLNPVLASSFCQGFCERGLKCKRSDHEITNNTADKTGEGGEGVNTVQTISREEACREAG